MKRRGFSLTDVLLGLLILTFIFFALASTLPVSLTSLRKSQANDAALGLARLTLEQWQTQPFSTIVLAASPVASTTTLDGVDYSVIVTISDVEPPDANIKNIDVQVMSAPDRGARGRAEDATCVFNWTNPW